MLRKLSLVTLSAISAFAMHTAEININDKDLELGVKLDLGQTNSKVEPDTTFLGFSYFNAHRDNSNANIGAYSEVNFLMRRDVQSSGLVFGLGIKSNYTKIGDNSYITIPLGLEVGFTIPIEMPIIIGAKVYYAPQSLAFSTAEKFLEYRADLSIEVIPTGSLIAGYRNINTDVEESNIDITYNETVYFGFRFAF